MAYTLYQYDKMKLTSKFPILDKTCINFTRMFEKNIKQYFIPISYGENSKSDLNLEPK